jgi:hypothetical protein
MIEQVPANSYTSNKETANQTINMIRNIREHIQNDECQCCKKILTDIFVQKETVTDFPDGKSTKSVAASKPRSAGDFNGRNSGGHT